MQFNITFKTIFEYILKKLVLCIQIRFVSTEKNYAHRLACILFTLYLGEGGKQRMPVLIQQQK